MGIAKPPHCRVHVEEVGDDLLLRRRAGSLVAGGILSLWLTVWTVVCVAVAAAVAREPTLEHFFFAVPFWSGWWIAAPWLVWLLFSSESLRIAPDGLVYRSRALVPLAERQVPLREINGIAHYSRVVDSESGRIEHGLKIETLGKPVRFGQGVGPMERLRLADRLHRHLQALVPDRTIEHRPEGAEKNEVLIEVMGPERAIREPPSDSTIEFRSDGDRAEFVQRGSFSLAAFGFVTLGNFFWNGVVAGCVVSNRGTSRGPLSRSWSSAWRCSWDGAPCSWHRSGSRHGASATVRSAYGAPSSGRVVPGCWRRSSSCGSSCGRSQAGTGRRARSPIRLSRSGSSVRTAETSW